MIRNPEKELIALNDLWAERHPAILVRFMPTHDETASTPERKCRCKRPNSGVAFCYCFCGGKESGGGANATEQA